MAFRVQISPAVRRAITRWGLPDSMLVEVHLRLRDTLPSDPQRYLRRRRRPFDGMVYEFAVVDPDNLLCEHRFWFLVLYRADEETLSVARGGYLRIVGL